MVISKKEIDDIFIKCDKIDYEEFKEKATFQKKGSHIPYKDYIESLKEDDNRRNEDFFLKSLYHIFVVSREELINEMYETFIKVDLKSFKFDYNVNIYNDENKLYTGSINKQKTRLIKGMFFNHIYDTSFYKEKPTETFITTISEAINENKFNLNLIINSSIQTLYNIKEGVIKNENGVKDCTIKNFLWYYVSIGGRKLSTFNPYTVLGILKSLDCKTMVTPTMGWNSYLLGFLNSNMEEYVGIDVIPEVLDKAKNLSSLNIYKKKKTGLRKNKGGKNKITDFYCCPSEEIDEKHNFVEKYENHFELSFCSPPYYDLEVYDEDNEDQSHNKFTTYESWLEGYWEETVKIIAKTLKKGGLFTFVISDFSDKGKSYTISNDMLEICKKHLDFEETRRILWTANTTVAEKFVSGNFEDFHILKKR